MSSLFAYSNVFLDQTNDVVTYTDIGATFSASPPIGNLSKMQIPQFAEFTETADFDAETGSTETARVFALIGHTLTDGMVVDFLADDVSIGTVTVANYTGYQNNAILVLSANTSFDKLSVEITGGVAATTYNIGVLWASPAFEQSIESTDFGFGVTSLSQVSYAQATGYAAQRDSYGNQKFSWTAMTRADAVGPTYPNAMAIMSESGNHAPVLAIPISTELAYSIYGLIDDMMGPEVRSGDLWRASVTIRQQR
jgi:hypothetical protein